MWASMPGMAIVRAPMHLFHAGMLEERVSGQRKALAILREIEGFKAAEHSIA